MSAVRYVLLAGILALATACGSSNSATPSSPTPATPPSTAGGSAVAIPTGARNLGAGSYVPNPITVAVGTAVTWTNNDSIGHTSTSDTGMFNSGTIAPGQSFSFTFQAAGTYPYHCTFHPGMVGSVVVQ
jgi:plastocyanin